MGNIFRFLLLIIVGVLSLDLQAQSIDSLLSRFRGSDEVEEKYYILDQHGTMLARSSPSLVLSLLPPVEEWVTKQEDSLMLAKMKNLKGVILYYNDQYQLSSQYYLEALELIGESAKNADLLIRLNNNIAWNLQKEAQYTEALKYYDKSLRYLQVFESANPSAEGLLYNNKGVLCRYVKWYDSALYYFRKSLAINTSIDNKEMVAFNFNNISNVFYDMRQYDSALYYLERATPLNYARKDNREVILNLINYGKLFRSIGQIEQASDSLQKAVKLAELSKIRSSQHEVYHELSLLKEVEGNYSEALFYYKQYHEISDSLFRDDLLLKLREVEIRSGIEKSQNALLLAESENREQRMLLVGIGVASIFLIVAVVALVNGLSVRKNVNERLRRMNEVLQDRHKQISEQNKIIIEKSEQLKKYTEEVESINENLEGIVNMRTQKLRERNETFLMYARMNAHDVRGPLARILGLIQLIQMETDSQVIQQYIALIDDCANDLDRIIGKMNEVLRSDDVDFL